MRNLNKHKDSNTNEPRQDLQTYIALFKEFDIQNKGILVIDKPLHTMAGGCVIFFFLSPNLF